MVDEQEAKRRRPLWRWVRDLSLLLLVFLAIQWWQTRDALSGPAPAMAGQLLSGETISLDEYRGRAVLVHFWATWCPVCRLEAGAIDAVADHWPVITLATSSGDAEEILAYLAEEQLNFPVLLDERGDVARAWGIRGVPTSFILDGDGLIRSVQVGYSTSLGLRARLWLAERGW